MYIVYFFDGSQFTSDDVHQSKWNELPSKTISKIRYSFAKVQAELSGFESYNHLVEHTTILSKQIEFKVSTQRISKIILLGLWKSCIHKVVFDIDKGRLFSGKEAFTKRYSGWKAGTFDDERRPLIQIF